MPLLDRIAREEEEIMAASANGIDATRAELTRFLRPLMVAREPEEIVDSVRRYLGGMSAERIARIQQVDAGWAPFDLRQSPSPLRHPADLLNSAEAVRRQCAALRSAGVPVTPELLELDLILFVACTKLEELMADSSVWVGDDAGAERRV
jgi:hypothetical protein